MIDGLCCVFRQSKYPELASELKRRMAGELPEGWKESLPKFTPQVTRNVAGIELYLRHVFTLLIVFFN